MERDARGKPRESTEDILVRAINLMAEKDPVKAVKTAAALGSYSLGISIYVLGIDSSNEQYRQQLSNGAELLSTARRIAEQHGLQQTFEKEMGDGIRMAHRVTSAIESAALSSRIREHVVVVPVPSGYPSVEIPEQFRVRPLGSPPNGPVGS